MAAVQGEMPTATSQSSGTAADGWKGTSVDYQRCLVSGASRLTCAVAFNSTASRPELLLAAGDDGHISLWNASSYERHWECKATDTKDSLTVTACSVLNSSSFLIGLADGRLQKWYIPVGTPTAPTWGRNCIAELKQHDKEITSIAVFSNGTKAITTSRDESIIIWDVAEFSFLSRHELHGCEVYGSAVLEDGSLAVTSGRHEAEQASIKVWCPSADGRGVTEKRFLVGPKQLTGWLDAVDIAKVKTPSCQAPLAPAAEHPPPSSAATATTLVAAAGLQGKVFVWDADSGAKLYSKPVGAGPHQCCQFSACGGFLLLGGSTSGELVMLESRYGQELLRVHTVQQPGACNTLTSCFFLQPSAATHDATSHPHSGSAAPPLAPSQQEAADYSSRYYDVPGAPGYNSSSGGVSPSSTSRFSWFGKAGASSVVDLRGIPAKTSAPLETSEPAYPTRFGAACMDGSLRIFNVTGDSYDDGMWSDARMQAVYDVDVSSDGKVIAVVYGSTADKDMPELAIYHYTTGAILGKADRCKDGTNTYSMFVQLSSDAGLEDSPSSSSGSSHGGASRMKGKVATVLDNGDVRIFNLAAFASTTVSPQPLQVIQTQHKSDTVCMKFDKDFKRMLTTASGGDRWIYLWDVECRTRLREFDKIHSEAVFDAEFTTDGTRVVSASCDKTAAIFDINTGEVIKRFVGHEHWVRCAVLSPNEEILATCSNDHTVRLWDVAKGAQLHVISTHKKAVASVVWVHPTWLVSSGRDGLLSAYNVQTKKSLPLLVGKPVTSDKEIDSVEKLLRLPDDKVAVAGSQFPSLLGVTVNNRAVVLNLAPRQPLPEQVIIEYRKEKVTDPKHHPADQPPGALPDHPSADRVPPWQLEHVAQLARAFPGLATLPMRAHGSAQCSDKRGSQASKDLSDQAVSSLAKGTDNMEGGPLSCGPFALPSAVWSAGLSLKARLQAWGRSVSHAFRQGNGAMPDQDGIKQGGNDPHVQITLGSASGGNTQTHDTQHDVPGGSIHEGDTLLHWAVRRGDVPLLREMITNSSSVAEAPLPANAQGDTPLDLALELGSVECVEALLASEVKRKKQHRLAIMKAWKRLAEDMPDQLVKVLKIISEKDAKMADSTNTVLVPKELGKHMRTLGSQDLVIHPMSWRKGGGSKATGVMQPVVPTVCGLPYVATASHDPEDTYFGALVLNGVGDALCTDIGYAVLKHKWENFAGKRHLLNAVLYVAFLTLYIVTTTLDLVWDPHVSRVEMYNGGGRAVARITLQVLVLLLDACFLWVEVRSLFHNGLRRYLQGAIGVWNAIEFLSSILVWLVIFLEVGEVEEARWLMSACTVLLGLRLLKIASGYEGTGLYVQIIIRIISDLRYFLLLVLVTLLTYAMSFWQVMIYFEQVLRVRRSDL